MTLVAPTCASPCLLEGSGIVALTALLASRAYVAYVCPRLSVKTGMISLGRLQLSLHVLAFGKGAWHSSWEQHAVGRHAGVADVSAV